MSIVKCVSCIIPNTTITDDFNTSFEIFMKQFRLLNINGAKTIEEDDDDKSIIQNSKFNGGDDILNQPVKIKQPEIEQPEIEPVKIEQPKMQPRRGNFKPQTKPQKSVVVVKTNPVYKTIVKHGIDIGWLYAMLSIVMILSVIIIVLIIKNGNYKPKTQIKQSEIETFRHPIPKPTASQFKPAKINLPEEPKKIEPMLPTKHMFNEYFF